MTNRFSSSHCFSRNLVSSAEPLPACCSHVSTNDLALEDDGTKGCLRTCDHQLDVSAPVNRLILGTMKQGKSLDLATVPRHKPPECVR